MVTPDPIAAFNSRLAHAKIHALQILLDLMASMTDPDAVIGDEIRELRLAATAILRTQPMKEPARPRTPPPLPHDPQPRDSTPETPTPADPAPAPAPTYRSNLNPTCRAARADIRRLIKEGVPEIIALFPDGLPPLEPLSPTPEPRPPPSPPSNHAH